MPKGVPRGGIVLAPPETGLSGLAPRPRSVARHPFAESLCKILLRRLYGYVEVGEFKRKRVTFL